MIKHSEMLNKIKEWKEERDAGIIGYQKKLCETCNGSGLCSDCESNGFVWISGLELDAEWRKKYGH